MLTPNRSYAALLAVSQTRSHQKIKQICEPLQTLFGIDAFSYQWLGQEGGYLYIGTRPDIEEDYLYSGQLQTSPSFSRLYYTLTPSIKIWEPCDERSTELHDITDYLRRHQLVSGMSLTVYRETGREVYYFGTHEVPRQGKAYWHHITDALYEFIDFFSMEAKTLLASAKEHQILLPELMGDDFYETTQADRYFSAAGATAAHRSRQWLRESSFIAKGLTRREVAIVEGCLQGQTAKQMAEALFISPRTVQNNLQALKKKFNCRSQKEMMALFV